MSMEREAEVLEMPTHADTSAKQARRLAQGRAAIERYVERLKKSADTLSDGPEAAELYCALAELREGMIDNDTETAAELYKKGVDAFTLSRAANSGLRRIHRSEENYEEVIASLERDIATATPEQKSQLRRELARTELYCTHNPERAISILETIREEELPPTDEETDEDDEAFDAELFFLWEDALLNTRAWERYETLLTDALSKQCNLTDDMPLYLITRMWILYRCILPDEEKAGALWESLKCISPLDDELVDYGMDYAERLDEQCDTPENLKQLLIEAIERDNVDSPYEVFFRLMLADLAHYKFDDLDLAFKVLNDGIERFPDNEELLHKNLSLCIETGDYEKLLKKAIPSCINIMPTAQLKAEQIHKIAVTVLDELESDESALPMLQMANQYCPTYTPTIARLEEIYVSQDNWNDTALLLENEMSYATAQKDPAYTTEVRIEKYARLAWMYEAKLGMEFKAFNYYQAILQLKPDDLAALKGAARMAQKLGNWKDLLKLYADAQNVVQDMPENNYLLEQIARISIDYHNDLDTACAALEELKKRELREPQSYAPLAKIYIQLEKWEELIRLTDEDVARSKNAEYKASLLYRNGEVSENQLSNLPQAIRYYELARTTWPQSRDAYAALKRIYRKQRSFEKLVELLKAHSDYSQDITLKCETMHQIADIQTRELDSPDEALVIYEKCLSLNPKDHYARKILLDTYQKQKKWSEVLRILQLELEAGGTFGQPWLTQYWIGCLQQYCLDTPEEALKSYEKSLDANIENVTMLRIWLDLALKLDCLDDAIIKLKSIIEQPMSPETNAELRRIYAELLIRQNHDPEAIASMLVRDEHDDDNQTAPLLDTTNSRLLTTMSAMIHAQRAKWVDQMQTAFESSVPYEIVKHALEAAVVMGLPETLKAYAQDALVNLEDYDTALRVWSVLPPNMRPPFTELSDEVMNSASHEAQDLRRWCAISSLLTGDTSDPTDRLLPDDNMSETMSYRPDLELLAAYFEKFENWEKFIWILEEQELHTLNEQEHIAIILQRAAALNRQQRYEDSIEAVRQACRVSSYNNPKRLDLYEYLSKEKDWDFLADTIREHIMHEDDKAKKAALWTRLSNIYSKGKNNLTEALNYLNQAYQNAPGDGSLLVQISRIAQQIGEYDIARRALDDYIEVHAPSLEKQLEIEPAQYELHFNQPNGDQQRMLIHFETLVKKTAEARDPLIILAQAHAKSIYGDPELAAQLLLRIVRAPELDDEDLPLWLLLADLYKDRLNQPQNSEQLLWTLFRNFPQEECIFDRLNAMYKENHERRMFVENLTNSVEASDLISSSPKLTRKYLKIAARVLGVELKQWNESQELYTRAYEADTTSDDSLLKELAFVQSQIPGEAKNAYEAFCKLLVDDPFQVEIYQAALAICKRHQANDRARVLLQLAKIFVPDAEFDQSDLISRPKIVDGRPLKESELLEYLLHPSLKYARTVLQEAMPHILPTFKDRLPKRALLGTERVKSHPIMNNIEVAISSFQLTPFKFFWSNNSSAVPQVFDGDCWLSHEYWEELTDEATMRHWAGYIGGLKWLGLETRPIFELGAEEIWHQLDGLYYVATGCGSQSLGERNAYTIEASKNYNTGFLSRNKYRAFADLVDRIGREHLTLADAKTWDDAIRNTADRAGLLFSGSLYTSIRALLVAEGWNPDRATPEYLKARFEYSKRIPQLLAFALSDDYLYLRKSAGIATHPSQITG